MRISQTVLLVICLLVGWHSATAAQLSASVDRQQLGQEEHLRLTLKLVNSDTRLRAEGVKPNIDLTLLSDDFTLGTPVADHRYNIYQGRGRATSSIRVDLFPRRSGTLTIPPFTVDGLSSTPIDIRVMPPSAELPPEVFVRSGANKSTYWLNEQVVAYIDLYHRVAIDAASFGDNLETEPTRIELLPHWKLEQSNRKEVVQGFEYDVQRVAWAVFPQQVGRLTVQLPDVWVTTQTGRKQRLAHQRLEFDVQPLPDGIPQSIIIGKPDVRQTRLPALANQYHLTHWSVSVAAPVAVTSLPETLPGIKLPDGLKLYADTARRNTLMDSSGIVDQADYVISVMPLEAGEFQLPPIRIPYFDPDTGSADYVEIEGQSLSVTAAALPQPQADLPTTDAAPSSNVGSTTGWAWPLATAILVVLWLTTLAAWWRTQCRSFTSKPANPLTAESPPKDVRHPLQRQLLNAMQSNTLEGGLAKWLRHNPSDETVLVAVRAVQTLCYGQAAEQEADVQHKVRQALAVLKHSPVVGNQDSVDIWDPKNFKATATRPRN